MGSKGSLVVKDQRIGGREGGDCTIGRVPFDCSCNSQSNLGYCDFMENGVCECSELLHSRAISAVAVDSHAKCVHNPFKGNHGMVECCTEWCHTQGGLH